MAVYFIRHAGHIKIGKSVDPWKRLASLQTAHHDPLEMLAIMPGSDDLEAGLHRAFGKFMKRGEWFEENPQLLAFIEMVKATFPGDQRNLVQEALQASPTEEKKPPSLVHGEVLRLGESFTFQTTHKGLFRYPSSPSSLWQLLSFHIGGYWQGRHSDDWWWLNAPGLFFEFVDMQHVTVTRQGDINQDARPGNENPNYLLESALKSALKEAVYNRKNTAPWLGVFNADKGGVVIAVRKTPQAEPVPLSVPDEVIAYWRQYKHPSPLPTGVSIEA